MAPKGCVDHLALYGRRIDQILTRVAAFIVYVTLWLVLGPGLAHAQEQPSVQPLVNLGDALVTGFSGVRDLEAGATAGEEDSKRLTIDVDGASLRGFDLSDPRAKGPLGQPLAPEFLSITAREIGQIFGIALDEATDPATQLPAANIYVTATSAYGLHIVGPDEDGDGSPDRLVSGAADARWMDGLFGADGGPGSVWKIDGLTGEVSLFANITLENNPNGGAALGNIAFDAKNRQLFVSDRDTGLIHRLDMAGNVIDGFDHGVDGRTAAGLQVVPFSADARADITSPSFNSEDPSTWGLAAPGRRVWGLAVNDGRLYYAVAEGPQIWSVGIKDDGSFDASDVRWELDLPADVEPNEIADITFTGKGQMILAQRPPATGAPDFRELVKDTPSRVLRYELEAPDDPNTNSRWVSAPDEYAIGLTGGHRSATGGVALGYGYAQEGSLDLQACEETLWATGDGLRESPLKTVAAQDTAQRGMGDGFQGTPENMVRPDNVPPSGSYAIDFDGQYPESRESGHVGDIEIASICPGEPGAAPVEPGVAPGAPFPAEPGVAPPVPPGPPVPPLPQEADLTIDKQLTAPCQQGGDCGFEIVVTNVGAIDYEGPLTLSDTTSVPGVDLAANAPPPWSCTQDGALVSCNHPTLVLKPGHSVSLPLTLRDPGDPNIKTWDNCVALKWLGAGPGDPETIRAVQTELTSLGYYAGPIDGIAGAGTQKGIHDLQKDYGLPQTGTITPEFLEWLFGQGASTATDPNPGNDGPVCVSVETGVQQSEGAGQLQVEKTGLGKCDFNTLCTFDIKITNPTNQPIKVTGTAVDSMTRTHDGAALANSVPVGEAPGLCTAGEGPAGVAKTPLECISEIDLGPNESRTYKIGIKLDDPKLDPTNNANLDPDPNVAFIAAENCILFQIPGSPLKSCTTVALGTAPPGSFDLAIEKTLKQAAAGGMIQGCNPDQPCRFTIKVTNNGPGNYVGPLIVKDDMPAGWQLVSWSGPTVCQQQGDAFSCSMAPQTTLASGQSVEWTIDLQPTQSNSDQMVQVENCAEIDWKGEQVQTIGDAAGDTNNGNDRDCTSVNIPPVPPEQPEGTGAWSGPAGKAFDLTIKKGAPQDAPGAAAGAGTFYVCEPLKACPFTVTITNVGIDKYDGPVSFKDTPKGWTYSGVSSGWSCTPGGDGFSCTGNVSLGPGESTSVALELKPSIPGVPVDPLQGENCVTIDWTGGPGDSNEDNDGPDCMPVILSVGAPQQPAVPAEPGKPEVKEPDLSVRKEAWSSTCAPGKKCGFNIIIRGTQDFPYKGKFKVSDIPPEGWTFAEGGKQGLWSCEKFPFGHCTYDVAKYPNLPADGFTSSDVLATDIVFDVPSSAKEGIYKNCVFVGFEPPPSEGIKESKTVCAEVQVGHRPDLSFRKEFDEPTCVPGEPCPFSIIIKNEGKGSYDGFLDVDDTFLQDDAGKDYKRESIVGGVFDCKASWSQATGIFTPAAPIPGRFRCQSDTPIAPGETKVIRVEGRFAAGTKGKTASNCAFLTTYPSDPKKLDSQEKNILVKRVLGLKGYTVSRGTGFSAEDAQSLAKYKNDSGYKTPDNKPDTSGKITDDFVKSLLPKHADTGYEEGPQKNCATVSLRGAGLTIEKKGPPESDFRKGQMAATTEAVSCQLGEACTFTITVKGDSDTPYTDPVTVVDSSDKGSWELVSYSGTGWHCDRKTPFSCTHPPANLTKSSNPLVLKLTMRPTRPAVGGAQGPERHPWVHNCAKIQYKDTAREGPQSCYKVRLMTGEGHYWEIFDYDATGTGNCVAPCTFYEFTATLRPRLEKPEAGASVEPAADYDPTGTGNCQPPNCGAPSGQTSAAVTPPGYSGALSMVIKLPPKAQFPNTRIIRAPSQCAASSWSCTQTGREFGNRITCQSSQCEMKPGDRVTLRLDGKVAPELMEPPEQEETREVCGELQYQAASTPGSIEQKVGLESKEACVTTRILARPKPEEPATCPREEGWKPYPEGTALLPGWKLKKFGTGDNAVFCMKLEEHGDLQVSTAPKGRCFTGYTCPVTADVKNVGQFPFAYSFGILGQVTPPVSIRSLVPSSGWECRLRGGGRYTCRANASDFAPGKSLQVDLGLAIPRNFQEKQITHRVYMQWLDGIMDKNKANNEALFTIPIKTCTGGKVPYVPKPGDRIRFVPDGCVCPDDTTEIDGKCVPQVQVPPKEVIQPKPAPGPIQPTPKIDPCKPPLKWDGRNCVRPPSEIKKPPYVFGCIGGYTRPGTRQCICPRGWTRKTLKDTPTEKVYRCYPTLKQPEPAPLTCINGTRRGNQCFCQRGWTLKKINRNTYRCYPTLKQPEPKQPPPPPQCTGNSILWQGKCVPCPPGKRANAAHTRCERISQPQPTPQLKSVPLPQVPQLKMIPIQPVCPPNHYWDANKKKCMARGTIR